MANHGSPGPAYQRISSPTQATSLYIIIDSRDPVITRIPKAAGQLTLGDFKDFVSLQDDYYKFYFQTNDPEFGTVKEEIVDDDAPLPVIDGKVVAWVLSNESTQSAALFEPVMNDRNHRNYGTSDGSLGYDASDKAHRIRAAPSTNSQPPSPGYTRGDGFTFNGGKRHSPPVSPSCILINLHLDGAQPLGLGHVFPSDDCQINGIIVGHVQHNSIAERDGRIKCGDRIVEVNGVDLRFLSLGEALRIFKQFVEKGGDINLVVQRPNTKLRSPPSPLRKIAPNRGPRIPPSPPARDPSIRHHTKQTPPLSTAKIGFDPATELPDPIVEPDQLTKVDSYGLTTTRPHLVVNFHRSNLDGDQERTSQSLPRSLTPRSWYNTGNLDNPDSSNQGGAYQIDSRSEYEPSTPTSLRSNLYQVPLNCTKNSIQTIFSALKMDSANLDVQDRQWLKLIVKDAFIGSTLIKWLSRNVYGFCNRSEVKRYANQMLALGLIRSPMSKATFSEKCFYTLS